MSYSASFMERHGVVLLDESRRLITVGIATDPPPDLRRTLECFHSRRVVFRRLSRQELRIEHQRAASKPAPGAPPSTRSGAPGVGIVGTAGGAPAVNLANSLLNEAVQRGASDIHVDLHYDTIVVRYRVDGVLRTADAPVANVAFPALSARLKALAGLNTAERRRPQDGRFTARLEEDTFDVRFSSMPTVDGESLVLRLFPRTARALTLDELGMQPGVEARLVAAIERGSGFVLISGPTGSGKTTTLHAALTAIDTGTRKIVTIEDPVEYRLPGIEQIQTNEAAGLTFDSLLRRVLRQDPNVIMVGEIRDTATAELSVRAALTGHLVLATVHSRNAAGVVDRLVNLGADPAVLALLEPLLLAQRLVRRRCDGCGGSGCAACYGSGLRGRTGLFELLGAGGAGGSGDDSGASGARMGFADDARRKLADGITTQGEVAWALAN